MFYKQKYNMLTKQPIRHITPLATAAITKSNTNQKQILVSFSSQLKLKRNRSSTPLYFTSRHGIRQCARARILAVDQMKTAILHNSAIFHVCYLCIFSEGIGIDLWWYKYDLTQLHRHLSLFLCLFWPVQRELRARAHVVSNMQTHPHSMVA